MLFYVKLQGKEVLEKIILVLEKSLIFSHKILYEPCFVFFFIEEKEVAATRTSRLVNLVPSPQTGF